MISPGRYAATSSSGASATTFCQSENRRDDIVPKRERPAGRCQSRPRSGLASDRADAQLFDMIRMLSSGKYRLYSMKSDPKTGRRRNLGTFSTRAAAEKHERAVQFFKRR
jgi:hypothetical protein